MGFTISKWQDKLDSAMFLRVEIDDFYKEKRNSEAESKKEELVSLLRDIAELLEESLPKPKRVMAK